MQDINTDTLYETYYDSYKIKIDDILKIDVDAEDAETTLMFNPKGLNNNFSNTKDNLIYNGYQVDKSGNINFPGIGKINASGKSVSELRDLIYDLIVKNKILNNPSVDIKLLNTHFTVLGEVNRPGRYEFLQNNLNIFEAIGIAGDLTINGKRNDIKLIRDNDGEINVSSLDLTQTNILSSSEFQIYSGDIIIVNPNTNRIKNAGIIGNSGTLLSLLSFILSSIIVISNN